MTKKLIIINGTMGVGKTTVCRELLRVTERAVWLDGDWCWHMNPWNFSEENKRMVLANIGYLLRNFLSNSSFDYVIFCWVLHQREILDQILNGLNGLGFQLIWITLTCSEEALKERIIKDATRNPDSLENSIGRLRFYEEMDSVKIDTSHRSVAETVHQIRSYISRNVIGEVMGD